MFRQFSATPPFRFAQEYLPFGSTRTPFLAGLVGMLAVHLASVMAGAQEEPLNLTLRYQSETSADSNRYHRLTRDENWQPAETALIICDMWDLHHCKNAVTREKQFAPRLNEVIEYARKQGVTIIHSPSDCMAFYEDHPARQRAQKVPRAAAFPDQISSWCDSIPAEEQGTYPIDQSDGGEDDDPQEHAEWAKSLEQMGRNPRAPWKRQIDVLKIDADRDFITDQGEEVWSILEQRGINNVILAGVHTNMCVLGRPFGLRQMAKNGKNVVLMRDMTDTMYNPQAWPYVSHFSGTDLIISHVERYVCPTITSDQLIGGESFRFAKDDRPTVAFLIAEDEYHTETSLPKFATDELQKDCRLVFVYGNDRERNDIPGIEAIDDADVLVISVRRRALPKDQLQHVRDFVASGRGVVGIRTASHAFSLRGEAPPEGHAVWERFDPEVFGGNYNNHYGNQLKATVEFVGAEKSHPILDELTLDTFQQGGSLYQTSPLKEGTKVLACGHVEGHDPEPVAWIMERSNGGRSFYTSLGHVDDFEHQDVQRMIANAIRWCAASDVSELGK